MRFNIITNDNGVGLSKDIAIISNILAKAGHTPASCDYRKQPPKADVNIFLELLDNPRQFKSAPINIFIPNLEWCSYKWRQSMNSVRVWCKTRDAVDTMEELGVKAEFIGFTSVDTFIFPVEKKRQWLHVYGKSQMKNTQPLLDAWRGMPSDCILHLVGNGRYKSDLPNVVQHGRLNEVELHGLMAESLWHVCASEAEGWGHYLHEAKAHGAAIITTDASPMRESVERENCILAPFESVDLHHMGTRYFVDSENMLKALQASAAIPVEDAIKMGKRNRSDFELRDQIFKARFIQMINQL